MINPKPEMGEGRKRRNLEKRKQRGARMGAGRRHREHRAKGAAAGTATRDQEGEEQDARGERGRQAGGERGPASLGTCCVYIYCNSLQAGALAAADVFVYTC